MEEARWTDWAAFAAAAPELAAFGEDRLRGDVAYLGTARPGLLPRVHPVSPIISATRLLLFMNPTSPKATDLIADGRYALHCGMPDHAGTGGEFLVRGRARHTTDPAVRAEAAAAGYPPQEQYIVFEFSVDKVSSAQYTDSGPQYRRWSP